MGYSYRTSDKTILTEISGGSVIGLTTLAGNNSTTSPITANNTTGNSTLLAATDTGLKYQVTINGQVVDKRIIGPGLPPKGWVETNNLVDLSDISTKSLSSDDVPSMTWSYGCSATSATMLFGYYDRVGYPNLYVGPNQWESVPTYQSLAGDLHLKDMGSVRFLLHNMDWMGGTTKGHKRRLLFLIWFQH